MEQRRLLAADISLLPGGDLVVTGTDGNDVMAVTRVGFDDVRVTVNALTRTFDMDDVRSYRMSGLGGDDQLTKTGAVKRAEGLGFVMDGGFGNDSLRGTEIIFTNGENIRDEAGTTVAQRQVNGDQFVYGTSGNDVINLAEESGSAAILEINSSFAGQFKTTEYNGWTVFAKSGNDTFNLGLFQPEVKANGEAGNDTFNLAEATNAGADGGAGDDLLRVGGDTFDQVHYFVGGEGADTIEMGAQTYLDLRVNQNGYNAFADVENVTNAQGTVLGNLMNNRITVRAGNTAGVEVHGAAGHDTIVGGNGPDKLYGDSDDDTLFGNAGNDLLDGGDQFDLLDGGTGTNTLLNGENDLGPQFYIQDGHTLRVVGTVYADVFSVVRVGIDDVRATVNGISRTFDMDDFFRLEMHGQLGNDTMTVGNGIEEVFMWAGAGNDRMTGNDRRNELIGDAGADTITANGGDDLVAAGDGNDVIDGGSGSDHLGGNAGDDTITGGSGGDDLLGGTGNDTLYARDGAGDHAAGEEGFDRARVDPGDSLDGIEQLLA
jgi:Ca2+-binding RTX toxin-like protein